MITSLRNDKVQYVRSLQSRRRVRERERRLVLEGVRLVEEAVRARIGPDFVFYTDAATANERGARLLDSLLAMGVVCYQVSQAVLNACSDTGSPQPVLAVAPLPDLPRPVDPTLSVITDGIRDPGNLGTILRTALAAGVELVLLAPGTVDVSNPKVVRAAMGAHLLLPLAALGWDAIAEAVDGADIWLSSAAGGVPYTAIDWTRPLALIVGGERAGAGAIGRGLAHGVVSIPMAAGVESLNTAIATAILLFEARRQRERTV